MPEFTDLVLCGYQGWFAAGSDNTVRHWLHWSRSGAPSPGNTGFELYPDVREYPADALRETGYGDLRNGQDSLLFGSEREGVVGLHFKWMRDYGIDGVALQRFVKPLRKEKKLSWRNKVAGKVRRQAEEKNRAFYVMYDISGAEWPSDDHATVEAELRDDFGTHIQPLTESPAHARQGGKPVVAIWGFGFKDRKAEIDDALATVAMLRDEFGCYVVLGVPYHWREENRDSLPGWLPVYESADMLIPWAVGRCKTVAQVGEHANGIWAADKAFCDQRGIDMQRVIFPGFAWSNLKSQQVTGNAHSQSRHAESQAEAAPRNAIPRNHGDFLWGQAFHVSQIGTGAFVAMFDEYDEATAIAKAATDDSMTPADEYFLTLNVDPGGEQLRSDHYLWLTGELTTMLKNPGAVTPQRPARPAEPQGPAPPDPVEPVVPPPVEPVAPPPVEPVAPPPVEPVAPPPARWTADEARIVVAHAYRALLNREADEGGLTHFAGRLTDGDSTELICQALASGDEFRNKNAGVSPEELAQRLYEKILGRPADANGLAMTIEKIESGKTGRRTAAMLESDEFKNKILDA